MCFIIHGSICQLLKLQIKQVNDIEVVNGNWGAWSVFGACSASCGGGTQTRTRLCNNPAPANGGAICPGASSESGSCNTTPCGTGKQILIL